MDDYVLRAMGIVARYEHNDCLFWRTDGKYAPISLFVRCDDLFHWACADLERITPENVEELELAFQDAKDVDRVEGWIHGPEFFCARVRKMRPQGAYYERFDPRMYPLFNACGPEREVDFGNPKRHKETV